MKITVLDKITMGEDIPIHLLSEFGELVEYKNTAADEVAAHIDDADVIVLNKVKITREVIVACKNLKLICVFATGYDNVDISAARDKNVAVCNVPGYSTDSVALFTVATVLSLVSHLGEYNDFVRTGGYSASSSANKIVPVFHDLRDKTWGVVGGGNIGSAVVKVAEAFGAKVIVNKRTPSDAFTCVDIDTLCKESDIITLHCPLNDSTRELINKERIQLMKKGVILVNEARGAVLNETDVADAVVDGKIAGFGCDVYSKEPFPMEHPYSKIMNMPNVILTPHCAWASYEARARCVKIISENISSYLKGEKLNRVDK